MLKNNSPKIMGWEISQQKNKSTIKQRLAVTSSDLKATFIVLIVWGGVFLIGCWLASNSFAGSSQIIPGSVVQQDLNYGDWKIIWSIVIFAIIFEFFDSASGMGYGTAFTPILLVLGYEPMQIVPVIMIQQACAGLTSAYIHREYGNIEWKFKPMSETTKLWIIIAITGSIGVVLSITTVYALFYINKFWIKLYISLLLLGMGFLSLFHAKRSKKYHPGKMYYYGALAGFNKGIGGGGYGPVVTIGGLMSGVPAKSMLAVTAISEGSVCVVSLIVWLIMLNSGVNIDFVLLPSMILGSIVSIIVAPYMVRVLPEKLWKTFVPCYCLLIGGYSIYKLFAL